jgi:hypothetical protein
LHFYKGIKGYYVNATEYMGLVEGKPNYRTVLLHKFITGVYGKTHIDHINNNTLDNREVNLRIIDKSNNAINRATLNENNTSGERNVSWSNRHQKWLVQLQVDGKNTRFGTFERNEYDKAVQLARIKRKEIYGIDYQKN